ncbi:MAG: hypothetical protein KIS92_13810 [Planctomycetota bacterium]|nr:hypothetical protein [Planctomycetota bacterium]
MYNEHGNDVVIEEYALATDGQASAIVRLEDFHYIRTPRKPKDLRRTALYDALSTVETLPRIRAARRRARSEGRPAETRATLFGRLWRWVCRKD